MTLYLWDNGECYDDHEVMMLDVESEHAKSADLVAFLDALGKCVAEANGVHRGGIIARLDSVEWMQPPRIQHAFDAVRSEWVHWLVTDDGQRIVETRPTDTLRAFPRALVEKVEERSGAAGLTSWIFGEEVTPS